MKISEPTALVLDGETNQAVATVRSLSRAGYKVEVGATARWSKAGLSRHCHQSFSYSEPEREPQGFVAELVARIANQPGALVMPMTDRTTLPISLYRKQIADAGGLFLLASHETILRALDKDYVRNLAESIGVSVPETFVINSCAEARVISERVRYPIVLKPRFSMEPRRDGGFRATRRARYATKPEELLRGYEQLRRGCEVVLVQEFISGTGAGYCALASSGDVCAEFAHLRLRDAIPTGSGSALRVSIEPSVELRRAGRSLLKALAWHGVAMVEFKLRPDSTPVLMEINGRFWGSLALAIAAGVDFPVLVAQMAQSITPEGPPSYRAGLRCRWLLGDVSHLIRVWRGKPREYPTQFPKRWHTLIEFSTPVRGTYHDNFRLDDPLPELGDWLQALREMASPLKARKNGAAADKNHA